MQTFTLLMCLSLVVQVFFMTGRANLSLSKNNQNNLGNRALKSDLKSTVMRIIADWTGTKR